MVVAFGYGSADHVRPTPRSWVFPRLRTPLGAGSRGGQLRRIRLVRPATGAGPEATKAIQFRAIGPHDPTTHAPSRQLPATHPAATHPAMQGDLRHAQLRGQLVEPPFVRAEHTAIGPRP